MNGAQLEAWVNTHKPQAAAAGLAVVVGAVWWNKRHQAGTAAPGTPAASYTPGSVAGGTVGALPYDSSANDVYNSVESVLEQLQATAAQISTTAPITQQVPVTDPGSTPTTPAGPSHPDVFVADQADEQIALAAGIPLDWLVATPTDPDAGRADAAKNGYLPPSDLPVGTYNPGDVYLGLAQQVAPDGATKVYGPSRGGTVTAVQRWWDSIKPTSSTTTTTTAAPTPPIAAPIQGRPIIRGPIVPPRTIHPN